MKRCRENAWKWVVVMAIFGVGLVMSVNGVKAEEVEKPKADIYVDALSQYIFRGVAFSKDSVVIQPSFTASYKGFAVNFWGNLDTDEAEGFGEGTDGTNWNETDVTLSYTHELFKGINGTVGTVYYSLVGDDSFEVFGGLSYAFPWVNIALTAYREVGHFPGWWVQLDLSRNFPLPWCGMSVDLGTSFGYQTLDDDDTLLDSSGKEGDYSAFTAGTLSAALNIPLGKYLTLSPRIGYAFPLSNEASDRIEATSWDGDADHVFGGIRIAASF